MTDQDHAQCRDAQVRHHTADDLVRAVLSVVSASTSTVGVYRGYDRISRARGADVDRQLRDAGVEVIALHPLGLDVRAPLGRDGRPAPQVAAFDVLVDSCRNPRPEPRLLARLLGKPLVTSRGVVTGIDGIDLP